MVNPVFLALGAANPGLLPLAFTKGGGRYPPPNNGKRWPIVVALLIFCAVPTGIAFAVHGPIGLWFAPAFAAWVLMILAIGGLTNALVDSDGSLAILLGYLCILLGIAIFIAGLMLLIWFLATGGQTT